MKNSAKGFCLSFAFILLLNISAMAQDTEFVPEWSKKVVWYQVFPERFHNGDKSNDPKLEDIKGSYPHDTTSAWQIHPWGSDWYQLQPYEKQNGKDIWSNIQRRRYGGDLQGIIDKLDYIQGLGVTAIYLNPVFWAPSLHKYDAICYHHVDPTFGPDPEGDKKLMAQEDPGNPETWKWTAADKLLLKLIDEVHKRKMYIILDGVFNHMGTRSFAFQDVLKNQQKSKYKDWFDITSFDDPAKGTKFDYKGWFGVKDLPEIKEDTNGIVDGPKEYIYAITERWMNPDKKGTQYGCDGWRLDVAFCIKHAFWKQWRILVKRINPEAYLTGEVIINDKISALEAYLKGDEFDAIMNYNFAFSTYEFFMADQTRVKPSVFDKHLEELRTTFLPVVSYGMQNLFDSHDTNRLPSMIMNADSVSMRNWDKYFGFSQAQKNPKYHTGKPTELAYEIQKLCVLFQMTYIGAPMVYYGDEVGMWGANDPDCRKPMVWEDMQYSNERFNPDQTRKEEPDTVRVNIDLLNYYKKAIAMRNAHPSLQLGTYETLVADDFQQVFGFVRQYNNEKIIVLFNMNRTSIGFSSDAFGSFNWKDLMTNQLIEKPGTDGSVRIPPGGGLVLLQQP